MNVVDAAIGIGVPHGDAAVEVRGTRINCYRFFGVAKISVGHMTWGGMAKKMAALRQSVTPFVSIN